MVAAYKWVGPVAAMFEVESFKIRAIFHSDGTELGWGVHKRPENAPLKGNGIFREIMDTLEEVCREYVIKERPECLWIRSSSNRGHKYRELCHRWRLPGYVCHDDECGGFAGVCFRPED